MRPHAYSLGLLIKVTNPPNLHCWCCSHWIHKVGILDFGLNLQPQCSASKNALMVCIQKYSEISHNENWYAHLSPRLLLLDVEGQLVVNMLYLVLK